MAWLFGGVTAVCVFIMWFHSRLFKKLNKIEASKYALEKHLRRRMDLIVETADKPELPAWESAAALCGTYRDAEQDDLFKANDRLEKMLPECEADEELSRLLRGVSEQIQSAEKTCREWLDAYNDEIAVMPGKLIALLFALKREEREKWKEGEGI